MWRFPPSWERQVLAVDVLVFSIFLLDETDFCNSFPWIGLLAFARDCDGRLLGHEFREHEGAFESRIFGGANFYVAVCCDVLAAAFNFA